MLAIARKDERMHHDGRHRVIARLQDKFIPDGGGRGWRDVVERAKKECCLCDQWQHEQKKVTEVICTTRPLQLVMFDVTTMPMKSPCGHKRSGKKYKHLLVVKDHFTKYTWIAAIRDKKKGTIGKKLKEIFAKEGSPERWHSDNGGELDNDVVDALQKELRIDQHSFGLARNPRCQGLVERCNATIKRSLMKKCQDNGYNRAGEDFPWHKFLEEAVCHENNCITDLYGISPFVCHRLRPFHPDGATRSLGPEDITGMYKTMALRQRQSRDKIAQRGHTLFKVGDIVRVRAGTALKRAHAIALYSATGEVEAFSPSGMAFVRLRWITRGLSGERPGDISKRMYFIGRLRKVFVIIMCIQVGQIIATIICPSCVDNFLLPV
jgi:hypothetical protein